MFPFSIAWRFLKSSKGQSFLIALGIAIGVSVQIFIGSLIQGLQIDLVDTTIGSQPQITISTGDKDQKIGDYETLLSQTAQNFPGVKYVSPVADGPALITINSDNFSILMRGMRFADSDGIYKINDRLVDGTLPVNANEVLIGRQLQEETGLVLGDDISILSGSGKTANLKVTGIFDLQTASLNRSWVLTTLSTAQSIFGYEGEITGIEMQSTDVFKADTIAQEIQATLPTGLTVDNWKDQNSALLSGLNGQSVSSYMIQVFVLISVLLGIASVLAITVVQKSKQIGILKAMGIRDNTASQIFIIEGLLLGLAGAVLGILLGLGLAFAFTRFALNPDGTPVVPLFINPLFIALSAGVAVVVSTLAALIPARNTSKLDPIEVIRNA
ncbi:MAG: FtsX-like permease family protein [Clostridiaceae bacterium]